MLKLDFECRAFTCNGGNLAAETTIKLNHRRVSEAASFCSLPKQQSQKFQIRRRRTRGGTLRGLRGFLSPRASLEQGRAHREDALALHFPLLCPPRELQRGHWIRPAETQEVCHMQRHYNEHSLGLGRQALILHGSHRELEPFKPAEDPCYHSPSEVLALPLPSKKKLLS